MLIEPRVLKGFRDSLPHQEIHKKRLVHTLEDTFSRFGFVPIDTPILEYAEVLLGKGGGETDKQVYRFTDHGGRDVAMRFDLTVPFARFLAANRGELTLPFKRYHIGKVFRGENTQRGRYREFFQCDFDAVGPDAVSTDFEILLMIHAALSSLGARDITIHVSHRGLFNRFLDGLGIRGESEYVLRTVDKVRKVGRDQTAAALAERIPAAAAERILAYIGAEGPYEAVLGQLTDLAGGGGPDTERLRAIGELAAATGVAESVRLDPSITRGLDYYTGVVFETFLGGIESIGSVCSGGRYDDLVLLYSKQAMPGVGASIGLDRLIAALGELQGPPDTASSADVLVTMQSPDLTAHYHVLAQQLRAAGIRSEVYPEARKLGQQFTYAERSGIPYAIVCGEDEQHEGVVNLRRLETRENIERRTIEQVVEVVRK